MHFVTLDNNVGRSDSLGITDLAIKEILTTVFDRSIP